MKISIFLLCYNEEILIPYALEHYRRFFPSATFTVYDNYSTDNSAELAKSLGCRVLYFNTKDELDEFKQTFLKNNCWKDVDEGWIIVCDMDEWLCIDEASLKKEEEKGVNIIDSFGTDMVGNSQSTFLMDINPHEISHAVRNNHMDKRICFKAGVFRDINYTEGAHQCFPSEEVSLSDEYLLKHMSWLGLPYKLSRNRIRWTRSSRMRQNGLAIHYKERDDEIRRTFSNLMGKRKDISLECGDCFWKNERTISNT